VSDETAPILAHELSSMTSVAYRLYCGWLPGHSNGEWAWVSPAASDEPENDVWEPATPAEQRALHVLEKIAETDT
jgi:hypothetical protein